MRRHVTLLLYLILTASPLLMRAQTGFYIPGNTRVKDMHKAMHDPETFALLLQFQPSDTTLSLSHLDWLDSAYSVAFSPQSRRLYTMRVESFASDTSAGRLRADAVVRYFSRRSRMPFPVRYAINPVHCSCMGDTTEVVRYEVPLVAETYAQEALPDSRRLLNNTVPLSDAVMLTFTHNPDACLGAARGCYVPAHDSTIRGYYTTLFLKRGSLYAVDGTKDSCPADASVSIEEHLEYRSLVERYFLVPHKKHIIVQSGYVVLHADSLMPVHACRQPLPDSITIQLPATQQQWDSKVRFFAKRYTDKGVEYRSLPTKKISDKKSGSLHIKAAVNLAQLDTVFIGKRIKESELRDYFYEVDSDRDVGAFTVGKRHYMAYRMDSRGEYEMKKALRAMFRIVPDEEEERAEDNPLDGDENDF
ncbi:MAG: hypothetical protein AUK63_253 [bacterium P3]|nr:MAG: hypothetical protein AUK63_253 [bacterium P3]KWW42285.1 MAG: hypothetical protein F083_189 [bacterium F083]